ncbi:MAG: hypothetical protein GYA21_13210 [Myxococcales bacterium]|nr:hypothetical protein [Myxococcales bacterium]
MTRLLAIALLLLPAGFAPAAPESPPASPLKLALLVGSNRPGPGQEELRYAFADALRVAEVLQELGGFAANEVQTLHNPDRAKLLGALSDVARRLSQERARGNPAVFVFYYSGHARAGSLNLGPEEIPLDELRRELLALPAEVTLVVLDACQSGAVSRLKGASPAADFSFNSVQGLGSSGVAIMASSTGSELSQESEALASSFFTHHLTVGLRGAADVDRDGRVTLSEAYRYAYHRTLARTAETALGRQHVTLENDIKGRGELVLTEPERSGSQVRFPESLAGDILVERQPAGVIVAEISKAAGQEFALALPAGDFSLLLRRDGGLFRCELSLHPDSTLTFDGAGCRTVPVEEVTAKGAAEEAVNVFGFELGAGVLFGRSDGYNRRLTDFGFDEGMFLFSPVVQASLTWTGNRYLGLGLRFSLLEQNVYQRDVSSGSDSRQQEFSWESYGLMLFARGQLPLFSGWLVPYLEAGGGLALGFTHYRDEAAGVDDDESYAGFQLGCAAGLLVMPWRHFGFYGQVSYSYARAIENRLGDEHDSGGLLFALGIRGAL